MPNNREPINLLLAKGRKHLTQEDIQRRMATEPTAPADAIQPPGVSVQKAARRMFPPWRKNCKRIKIIGNVDAGELGPVRDCPRFLRQIHQASAGPCPRKSGRGCGSCGLSWRRRKAGRSCRRGDRRRGRSSGGWSAVWFCFRINILPSVRLPPGPWGSTSQAVQAGDPPGATSAEIQQVRPVQESGGG